jgi:hypothetical protein
VILETAKEFKFSVFVCPQRGVSIFIYKSLCISVRWKRDDLEDFSSVVSELSETENISFAKKILLTFTRWLTFTLVPAEIFSFNFNKYLKKC